MLTSVDSRKCTGCAAGDDFCMEPAKWLFRSGMRRYPEFRIADQIDTRGCRWRFLSKWLISGEPDGRSNGPVF